MNYAQASRAYRRVGAANAEGEAKLAMYASTVPQMCALQEKTAPKFYAALQSAGGDPLDMLKHWHDHPLDAVVVAIAD